MITYWMSWVPVRANAGLRQGSNKSFSLLEDMKSKCTGKKAIVRHARWSDKACVVVPVQITPLLWWLE